MAPLDHLLIDWLTLRLPLDQGVVPAIRDRVLSCLGRIQCYDADGALMWEKNQLDLDKLRSDTAGVCWQVQSDGKQQFLVVGGSPASLEFGCNVFGTLDIGHGARVLIEAAGRALHAILPPIKAWQCRRVDVTGNYALPDADTVKLALRMLSVSDAARRHASHASKGGDTVVWNGKSDLNKGKAYHKGPQLHFLKRKGRLEISDDHIDAAGRLLRLEHTRGARWFRRLEEAGADWWALTGQQLWEGFRDFFSRLVEGVEVTDMNRTALVTRIMQVNDITEGRAEAAFTTLRNIREDGFEAVKGYMAKATFYLHMKYLRAAGVSDADMHTAKVLPFRPVKIVLAQPCSGWAELMRAA